MNKYKVQFLISQKYIVDVLAENQEEAEKLARAKFSDIVGDGMEHYHEDGDPETEIDMVFDVTNTDDPFNP